MSPADFLDRILSMVEQAGVDYMVTGSIASSHHGVPRATQDLDLVIEVSEAEPGSFWRGFQRRITTSARMP
ncbi:MAG: hypothetical protein HY319_29195 [Armatimonadetes bacterium]|nr:hypothetical protein [Armatimonadota bacterium]